MQVVFLEDFAQDLGLVFNCNVAVGSVVVGFEGEMSWVLVFWCFWAEIWVKWLEAAWLLGLG